MDTISLDNYFGCVEKIKKSFAERCPFEEVSGGEFFMMKLLIRHEKSGENVTAKSISEYLNISRPAVSQMLNGLEKKGFIERSVDENDRRQICIKITNSGKTLVAGMCKKHEEIFGKIMNKVGAEDIKELQRILNSILNALIEK